MTAPKRKSMADKTGKVAAGLRAVERRLDKASTYAGTERRQPRRAMAIRTLRP